MMHIFSAFVYDIEDGTEDGGYGIHLEVDDGVPQDVVTKIAKEVAETVALMEFPSAGQTSVMENPNKS